MKRFLFPFFLILLASAVYCVQYTDFHPFSDVDMQMRFRVKNMANPVNPQDAATKKYVDDAVSGGTTTYVTPEVLEERIISYDTTIKGWANGQHTLFEHTIKDWASGQLTTLDSTLRGWVTANFLPSEPLNIHLRGDLHADGNAAIDGGLTVGGEINMQGSRIRNLQSPVADNDAATKAYVSQNYLKLVGGRMEGEINMAGLDGDKHRIVNLADYGTTLGDNGYNAVNKHYVDGATNAVVGLFDGVFLPLLGGSMSGNISMSGNYRITNLATPPLYYDEAAPKQYVDDRYSEAVSFYRVSPFVFSSSLNFSKPLSSFSVPVSGTSFYARVVHPVSAFSNIKFSIFSEDVNATKLSVSFSPLVGTGTKIGDILMFSLSPYNPASLPSHGANASFVLYDSNASKHAGSSPLLLSFFDPDAPVPALSFALRFPNNSSSAPSYTFPSPGYFVPDASFGSNDLIRGSLTISNTTLSSDPLIFSVTPYVSGRWGSPSSYNLSFLSRSSYIPLASGQSVTIPYEITDFSPYFGLSLYFEISIEGQAGVYRFGVFNVNDVPLP